MQHDWAMVRKHMAFPPNSSWKKEMAVEHVAGTGRYWLRHWQQGHRRMFKSVCAFTGEGGADLNIYMCAWIKKHKGVQTGREQWSELKRETLTHIREEPVYLQETYRVREWNLWYVLKLRSPVCRGEVKCAAPDPTLITSLITNKTKAEQTSICSPAECAMAAFV